MTIFEKMMTSISAMYLDVPTDHHLCAQDGISRLLVFRSD